MTIDSDTELEWTQHRISDLERSLAGARHSLAASPRALADMLALYQHELDDLQLDVRRYLGLSEGRSAPLELGFETKDGAAGTTTLSALGSVVGALRVALTSVGERLAMGTVRELGRPTAKIGRAVNLRVIGFAPGSFNLLLEFPVPPEDEIDDSTKDLAERSLDTLEQAARWVNSEEISPPAAFTDPEFRQLVLDGLKSLSPSDASDISWIEFRRTMPLHFAPVRLTSKTYHRIAEIMEESAPSESIVLRGKLREIDLERRSFDVRTPEGARHRCRVSETLLAQALDHIHAQRTVLVRGTLNNRVLDVISLEPVAETESPG